MTWGWDDDNRIYIWRIIPLIELIWEYVCIIILEKGIYNTVKGSPSLKSREMMRSVFLSFLSTEKYGELSNSPASSKSLISLSSRAAGTASADSLWVRDHKWVTTSHIYYSHWIASNQQVSSHLSCCGESHISCPKSTEPCISKCCR